MPTLHAYPFAAILDMQRVPESSAPAGRPPEGLDEPERLSNVVQQLLAYCSDVRLPRLAGVFFLCLFYWQIWYNYRVAGQRGCLETKAPWPFFIAILAPGPSGTPLCVRGSV